MSEPTPNVPMTNDPFNSNLSYGEKSVGKTFNPGGMPEVDMIKERCASVIDELNAQRQRAAGNVEKIEMFTLAIRAIQEGQMWGVKAATWRY